MSANAVSPRGATEAGLQKGLALGTSGAAVELERPGIFRVKNTPSRLRYSSAPGLPAEEVANDLLVAAGRQLWIVGEPGARVQATRVYLGSGASESLSLQTSIDSPIACDVKTAGKGPVLAMVTSFGDTPAILLASREEARSGVKNALLMALDRTTSGSAVATSLESSDPVAVAWSAATRARTELRLRQWSFAPPDVERAAWGAWGASLRGTRARAFELPEGKKRIRIALGASTVAALSTGDTVQSVHWAGGETFEETIETTANRLTLLHTREEEDRAAVDLFPATGDLARLDVDSPYERFQPAAGTLRVPIAPGDGPRSVHVRGAGAEVVLLGADGKIERGQDVPVGGPGGTALLSHGTGWLLAWVSSGGETGLWGASGATETAPVTAPARVPLEGALQSFHVDTQGPAVLHVRTATPVVTRLVRGRGRPEVQVHAGGATLDAYVPEGSADLTLRAPGGGSLTGAVELNATVVTPIGEGLGPEVVLPSGGTEVFSFTVTREGVVGIGVRADSDVVDAALYEETGKRIGVGVVQMPSLSPGTYLLALSVPSDRGAARARPALSGIVPPDTGPAADVVRRYFEMETKGKEDKR